MGIIHVSLIFGGLFTLISYSVFLGIRFRKMSSKQAALIMFLFPIVFEIVLVLLQIVDPYGILCLGVFLSLIFGSATYIFGSALETRISKQE